MLVGFRGVADRGVPEAPTPCVMIPSQDKEQPQRFQAAISYEGDSKSYPGYILYLPRVNKLFPFFHETSKSSSVVSGLQLTDLSGRRVDIPVSRLKNAKNEQSATIAIENNCSMSGLVQKKPEQITRESASLLAQVGAGKPAVWRYSGQVVEYYTVSIPFGKSIIAVIPLAEELIRLADAKEYSFVGLVLIGIPGIDRNSVFIHFFKNISANTKDLMMRDSSARHEVFDRAFDRLWSGITTSEEEDVANQILKMKLAYMVSPEQYDKALVDPSDRKIFPFRLPGFTVFAPSTFSVELHPGRVWIKLVTFCSNEKYAEQMKTLPPEVCSEGITLPEDELIGIRLYDDGNKVVWTVPLALLGLAHMSKGVMLQKMFTTVFIAAGFAAGSGAWAALDKTVAGLVTTIAVVQEHRGWIVSEFGADGEAFLTSLDKINTAAAIYGIGRVVSSMPQVQKFFKTGYERIKARIAAARDARKAQQIQSHIDVWIAEMEAQAAQQQAAVAAASAPKAAPATITAWVQAAGNVRVHVLKDLLAKGSAEWQLVQQVEAKLVQLADQAVRNVRFDLGFRSVTPKEFGQLAHRKLFDLIEQAQVANQLPKEIICDIGRANPNLGLINSFKPARGNMLRPDIRLSLGNGREAIWDLTTVGQKWHANRYTLYRFTDYVTELLYVR